MKQFFYFLTLFASIGTVGLVATNPKLVQQGTAMAGRIGKAVTEAISEERAEKSSEETGKKEENLAAFLAGSPYAGKSRYASNTGAVEEAPPWHFPEQATGITSLSKEDRASSEQIDNEPISNEKIASNWSETPSAVVPAGYDAPKQGGKAPITLASIGMSSDQSDDFDGPPQTPTPSPFAPIPPEAGRASTYDRQPFVQTPVHTPNDLQNNIPASDPFVSSGFAHSWSDPMAPAPIQAVPNNPIANQHSSSQTPQTSTVNAALLPPLAPMQQANIPSDAAPFGSVPLDTTSHPMIANSATQNPVQNSIQDSMPQNPMAQLNSESIQTPSSYVPSVAGQTNQVPATAFGSFYDGADGQPASFVGSVPSPSPGRTAASPEISATPTTPAGISAANPLAGQNIGQFQISPSVVAEVVPCHGTETVARVGTQVILMCDILPQLRRVGLRQFKEQLKNIPEKERGSIPSEAKEEFLEQFIVQSYPALLQQQITFSMIYNDFLMSKSKEEVEFFTKKIGEEFDEEDVPAMMKEFGVNNLAELKIYLKEELGSSLDRERMLTIQSNIARQWVMFSVKTAEGECTHDEMMEYYTANQAEFETKARVKWQELQVLFSKHPNEQEAWKKIVWMGNEVTRGVPMDEMAKVNSEGFTASKGGVWDWTSKGSLSSSDLEKMVFTHPVGQLSPIVKTATGLHIIKPIERDEDKITPFIEAQVKIREQIRNQRRAKYEQEYFEELQRKYPCIVLRESIDFKPSREISTQAQSHSDFR